MCIVRHEAYPSDAHVRRDAETLAQAGYDVSVVALRSAGQPSRELVNGVAVYRLPVEHHRGSAFRYAWEYLLFLLLAAVFVAALHWRKRFRIVEVDNMPDVLVFSALVPKLMGARVILYIFDNMPELLAVTRDLKPGHPLVRLLALFERLSAAFADQVIVTQDTARGLVLTRGVPESKVAVVLNCPDESLFPISEPRRHRREGPFTIVTHGSLLERYGVQVLIDALPRLVERVPDVCVDVFGKGEYRRELEARALSLGVHDRVCFRGLVPFDELVRHLSEAHVGYVGMLCNNMLSNKLMEYVALGVPAVVARWPTYEHYFPESTVTYFRAGSAQDLADVIQATYDNPEQARTKASQAIARYRQYRWTIQREAYLSVYRNLLVSKLAPSAGETVHVGTATP